MVIYEVVRAPSGSLTCIFFPGNSASCLVPIFENQLVSGTYLKHDTICTVLSTMVSVSTSLSHRLLHWTLCLFPKRVPTVSTVAELSLLPKRAPTVSTLPEALLKLE